MELPVPWSWSITSALALQTFSPFYIITIRLSCRCRSRGPWSRCVCIIISNSDCATCLWGTCQSQIKHWKWRQCCAFKKWSFNNIFLGFLSRNWLYRQMPHHLASPNHFFKRQQTPHSSEANSDWPHWTPFHSSASYSKWKVVTSTF